MSAVRATTGVSATLRKPPMTPTLSPERAQRIDDAERWQAYARRMNDRAIAAGLVSPEEVAQGRARAQEALARLRATKNGPTIPTNRWASTPKGISDAEQAYYIDARH